MSARRALAVALASVLLGDGADAQPAAARARRDTVAEPAGPVLRDLERSSIYSNVPEGRKNGKTGEIYEAYLAAHFSLLETIARADSAVLRKRAAARRQGTALTFTMGVNLRQTFEASAPVRTPSYLPKLTWQRAWTRRLDPDTAGEARNASPVRSRTLSVTLGHYSNGQDACLFVGQVHVAPPAGKKDSACAFPGAAPARRDLLVNRRDGDFSSHYLQLGWTARLLTPDATVPTPGGAIVAARQRTLGVVVRNYDLLSGVPGGMSAELRRVYGPTRVRLAADRLTLCARGARVSQRGCGPWGGPGQLRVGAWAEALLGPRGEGVWPVRGAVEVARTSYRRGNLGPFLRVYAGQDDYNLGFLTRLVVAQVGITIDPERLPAFAASF